MSSQSTTSHFTSVCPLTSPVPKTGQEKSPSSERREQRYRQAQSQLLHPESLVLLEDEGISKVQTISLCYNQSSLN